jgi:hypothetical protein
MLFPRRFLLPFVRPYGGISWYLACLSPTSAASLMAAALLNWERVAAGVTLQTLWLPVTQGSSFCVGSVLLLLAADVLLFAALTWYSDKVRALGASCAASVRLSCGWSYAAAL